MSFLNPWMLFGLGALALPILIHLWQRRRVVQIPFGTLRFLKAVASRTRRSSRIENLLLLLLRCLVFALVALAVARPVMLARSARLFGGEVPRTVVIVIDNSASMAVHIGGQTRLETAKACALALLDDLKQGDRAAVLGAGDRVEFLVAEPTIDRAVARKAIAGVGQTETRSDFAAALREAGKIALRAERGERQIFLFSDSQKTAWRPVFANPAAVFDTAWKQAQPQLVVVRPDDARPANAAVKSLRLQTPCLTPGSPLRGAATVENFGSSPLHDLLTFSINGQRVAQRPADVPPGASVEISFEGEAPAVPGRWAQGSAALSGDALALDDTFPLAVPVVQTPRVAVVEGAAIGPESLRPGYFLRKALAAGAEPPIQVRTLTAAQLDETGLETLTAVFLANPGKLSDRSAARLERFLAGGGTVAVFPGDQTPLGEAAPYLPGTPSALRSLPAGRQPVRILEPSHPLFAGAWDSGVPFPALPQQRIFDWKPAADARPLLALGTAEGVAGGLPLVLYAERGPGRLIAVNASADRSWGDLPLSPAFVPLVQQIARFSAIPGAAPYQLAVGDPIPLSPALPRGVPVRITEPGGAARTRTFRASDDARTLLVERAGRSGFYRAEADNGSSLLYAVHASRDESAFQATDADALEKETGAVQIAGREALAQWLAKNQGLVPLWPLLLMLAGAVFVLEAVLSNVLARRRAQGEGKTIATGRLNRRRMGVPFYERNPEAAP